MAMNLNPFSKKFLQTNDKQLLQIQKDIDKNSQGVSVADIVSAQINTNNGVQNNTGPSACFDSSYYELSPIIMDKQNKIIKYNEMARFPEITEILDIVSDEVLPEDTKGKLFELKINNKGDIRKNLLNTVQQEFDYVVKNVIKAKKRSRAWQLFKRFLIEGELYAELISSTAGDRLIGIRILPASNIHPVYQGNIIKQFTQFQNPNSENSNYGITNIDTKIKTKTLEANQVSYINYYDYGQDFTEIRGYLDPGRKIFNHLRNLEDTAVASDLIRGPERRIWNVDMGKIPPGLQQQHLQNMVDKYRKKMSFDPLTGEMSSGHATQNMLQDYWFAKGADGKGTTADIMGGAGTIKDLGLIRMMQSKLYKVLKIPKTRWDSDKAGPYQAKKNGEIEREEIQFAKFIKRMQGIYKEFILQIFFQHLRMKLSQKDYKYISTDFFDIDFIMSNEFEENRRIEQTNERLSIYSQLSQDILTTDNLTGEFSEEFVLKDLVGFSDEQYERHILLKNRDKTLFAAAAAAAEANTKQEDLEDFESGTGNYSPESEQTAE